MSPAKNSAVRTILRSVLFARCGSVSPFVAVSVIGLMLICGLKRADGDEIYLLQDQAELFRNHSDSAIPLQKTSLSGGLSAFTDWLDRTLGETSNQNHAGLLGRAYFDGQYISLITPKEFEEFSSTMPGFRTSLNMPAPWTNQLPAFLFQDIFISARHLGFAGSVDVSGLALSVDSELDDWVVGTTLFASIDQTFRPFLQLGYDYQQFRFESSSILGKFSDTDTDHRFFCTPGFEIDMTAEVALRFATELDFEDMESSIMTTELVYWFGRNVFARGGLVNDAEWEIYGGIIGGGIAY